MHNEIDVFLKDIEYKSFISIRIFRLFFFFVIERKLRHTTWLNLKMILLSEGSPTKTECQLHDSIDIVLKEMQTNL